MLAMWNSAIEGLGTLLHRGGFVMWPLAAMSVVGITLIFERAWFWLSTNSAWRIEKYSRVAKHLREGRKEQAEALIEGDHTIYARLLRQVLDEGASDAVVTDAMEKQRPRIERFMATLGTTITAAPMLGILGTVSGITSSFRVLSTQTASDPSAVGAGIAESLIATLAGLVVALVVLFPYNAFRSQIDRAIGQMQSLVASAQAGKK
jgi:biopolymer transport protein ExbB